MVEFSTNSQQAIRSQNRKSAETTEQLRESDSSIASISCVPPVIFRADSTARIELSSGRAELAENENESGQTSADNNNCSKATPGFNPFKIGITSETKSIGDTKQISEKKIAQLENEKFKSLFQDRNSHDFTSESNNSDKSLLDTSSKASERTRVLQQQIDDATISADQRLHLKLQQAQHETLSHLSSIYDSSPSGSNTGSFNLGYQLRALSEQITALEANPWIQAPTLPNDVQISTLSSELVNETLNYFVNCGQRLSQMTKTYDDNDAYLLLLQEKEVDLELAARIGQDLLKQNKHLKESIKCLEDELLKRQEDVQQLKHELASKVSLLDTFIEEEESQNGIGPESEDETTVRQQDIANNRSNATLATSFDHAKPSFQLAQTSDSNDNDQPSGFLSLNFDQQKPPSSIEPFSSLPYNLNNSIQEESNQLTRENSSSSIAEQATSKDQQHLFQTVTFQLVESNKRLCELQDELFYKGEQNLLQQEKIIHLHDQIRESDRRLGEIATENESLQKIVLESKENRRELMEELKICKRNFSELLSVFLELQKESRLLRLKEIQDSSNINFPGEIDQINDINNISFDSFNDTPLEHINNGNNYENLCNSNTSRPCSKNMPTSASLLEELQESMRRNGEDNFDTDATDGGDSGVHTANISSSASPTQTSPNENDSDASSTTDLKNKRRNWLGFSSFMLTSILLLCLSITLNSNANLNLAQKLQNRLAR